MNVWNNAVITDQGIALQTKLIAGNTLDITRAIAGLGYVTPGLLKEQTEVIDAWKELAFQAVSYPEYGRCKLPMTMTNDDVETGQTVRMIYIMAQDPDEGEIIFAVAQSVDSKYGTIVPSASEMPGYSAEWTFYFQYGRADGVNVMVDPTGFVSRTEMEEYVQTSIKNFSAIEAIPVEYIDEVFGFEGADFSGGGGEAGAYTLDHSILYNRDDPDQHPIESITGLEEALEEVEGEELDTINIEEAWETTEE